MNPLAVPGVIVSRAIRIAGQRKRIAHIREAIRSLRQGYERAQQHEMVHYKRIYNSGLYILLLEYDMAILINDALLAVSDWRKRYVARQLAVVLYEATQDIPEIFGGGFRDSLRALPVGQADWDMLNATMKRLNQFRRERENELRELRNVAGAHRDKDAIRQLELIESVELLELMSLSVQFYDALRDLVPLLIRLISILGDWRVAVRHMKVK